MRSTSHFIKDGTHVRDRSSCLVVAVQCEEMNTDSEVIRMISDLEAKVVGEVESAQRGTSNAQNGVKTDPGTFALKSNMLTQMWRAEGDHCRGGFHQWISDRQS